MKKFGFVSISGRANVGKSTILNGLLNEKIAIVSAKPETTRDNIRGILTDKDCQCVFIDTPGIGRPHDLLGKIMLSRAQSSLMETDIVLFVTDKNQAFGKEDQNIRGRLPEPESGKKVILVINKVDKVKDKKLLLPLMNKACDFYPFDEIVPISALSGKDIETLLRIIKKYLPEGSFHYEEDDLTDKSSEFMIREIIREKILSGTFEEIPHAIAIMIDEIKEEKGKVNVSATIFVERVSQKSIIIGSGGAMLKKIGTEARKDIEKLILKKVRLNLWVKVYDKWKKNPSALRELGYTD